MTPGDDPNPDRPPGAPAPSTEGSPAEEADLLRRTARGDATAFETLYRRHAPAVMAFLFHLTQDRALAEDGTQEAFVRAWKAAGRFDPSRARVRTWLFQIAKNHAFSELPRWRRSRAEGGDAAPPEIAGREPSPPAGGPSGGAELAVALRAALVDLSETLRASFVLVRILGLPYAEAAEALDVPEGTVKSRTAAAEAWLRGRLRGFA